MFSPRLLTVLIFQFSKPRRNSYTLHASFKHGLEPFQATPRWRSGHAVDCRSTILRFKSGPWLSIAATAGVSHPFPFRTRKLRHLTWILVLSYASPRERTHAAIVQTLFSRFNVIYQRVYRFSPEMALNSGHSRCVTPVPIPNTEVKTPHVDAGTEVRESSGTHPRCYCSNIILTL